MTAPKPPLCPAWPKCDCILQGVKDVDCKQPYGLVSGYTKDDKRAEIEASTNEL